ncbi:septin SPR28 NDAI_0C04880 [Naumovozyma dairenensis CBS 421]|uniref:Septin-type G domain-containing protein n=1 Tax=Naumovozyma dairenensis (strain ATCC 10597 / BCRC 20456 / CBS 421 / NBRC 0211 / NRRL Y-12639) TaxID=1071378 RepID=G0W8N6_NAUDC|nr:hypothetical protein NDAI_0C04880 [Naumovozyma dairenensis CBS 421]CCD24147.1 hypothetical protein NDAI_0C04880 [Naumovozyma dairenensis CBS 421]
MENQYSINTDEIRRRRNAKKAIHLNVLLLGETGIGKSTFLNNLCLQHVDLNETNNTTTTKYDASTYKDDFIYEIDNESPMKLITKTIQIKEDEQNDNGGVPIISLKINLFQGFGDKINNLLGFEDIRKFLISKFDNYLKEEIQIKRNFNKLEKIDERVHVCIYFIKPTSKGLKEFDIKMMKNIHDIVNIIPVIAKSDLLTVKELELNKNLIMKDIQENHIEIFDFKDDKLDDILLFLQGKENKKKSEYAEDKIKDLLPFNLVCSEERHVGQDDGKLYHVRDHGWSKLIIEDKTTSDFIFLKSIILGSHLQEFKDITNDLLYENYRTKKLSENEILHLKGKIQSDYSPRSRSRSQTTLFDGTIQNDELIFELEEKNIIIEAYQRKIDKLQNKLVSSTKSTLSPTSP